MTSVLRKALRKRHKLILVGGYPPPYGGNSVHIKRLMTKCLKAGLKCYVLDPYNVPTGDEPTQVRRYSGITICRVVRLWKDILRMSKGSIVHFHVSAFNRFFWIGWLMLIATMKSKSRIITIHSGSFISQIHAHSSIYQWLLSVLLRRFDFVIVVNEVQLHYVTERLRLRKASVRVIPAFIPPLPPPDRDNLRLDITAKLALRERPTWLLLTSGYGTKQYGFELVLEAVERVQKQGINTGLVIVIYSKFDKSYLKSIAQQTSRVRNVVILENLTPEEFSMLQTMCDIYIRATLTDGDAVAIREAAMSGCRIAASDCVPRPKGCALFSSGSSDSLALTLQYMFVQHEYGRLVEDRSRDRTEEIISLYNL